MRYDDLRPYRRPQLGLDPRQDGAAPTAEARDRRSRAEAAVAAGCDPGGTVAERINRAEQGMVHVTDIAHETDDRAERHAILALNETLFSLAQALRSSRVTEDYAAVGWG